MSTFLRENCVPRMYRTFTPAAQRNVLQQSQGKHSDLKTSKRGGGQRFALSTVLPRIRGEARVMDLYRVQEKKRSGEVKVGTSRRMV